MITSFRIFEVRIGDNSKLFGDNELIKKHIDAEFEVERNLVKQITLNKRVNKKKLRFKISYYDNFEHEINKRIEDRTDIKNIEEFNELLKLMINTIIQTEYLDIRKKYGCYFEDYNFTIIFSIIDFIKNPEIVIITIIPGYTDYLSQKTFFI